MMAGGIPGRLSVLSMRWRLHSRSTIAVVDAPVGPTLCVRYSAHAIELHTVAIYHLFRK